MKRLFLLALCLLMVVGQLAACGGTETPAATEGDTPAPTEPGTAAPTVPAPPAETDAPTEPGTEAPTVPDNALLLTDEGKSDYRIVVAAACEPAEMTAATELQAYLAAMSGVTLPIVKDSEAAAPKEIVVGKTNRAAAGTYEKEDSWRAEVKDAALYIAGGSPRGTLYGVYGFLESLGCRFFATDVETVPEIKTVYVLSDTRLEKTPAFDYRDVYWACAYDPDLGAKLGLNASVNSGLGRYLTEEQGGGISYAEHLVHSMMYVIPPSMFAEHPEYFCERGGNRYCGGLNKYQACMTNPEVLQLTITAVRSWLEKYPDAKIVTVSQADNDFYCTCAGCQAIIDEEGTAAGPVLRFVNAVADAIAEDYPDVYVDTLAYHHSIVPPKVTKARDNVVIRFCLSNGCVSHAYNDPDCADNQLVREAIVAWKEICPRLYVWDYNSNYTHYLCPKPNFALLQTNARFFYENKVVGAFYQGIYNEPNNKDGEFGALRTYILAKLMWDPYADVDALMDEFMLAYYGEGGAYIKEYIQYLDSIITKEDYVRVNYEPAFFKAAFADEEALNHYNECWAKAKEAAKDDPAMLERIERSELQYRYIKAVNRSGMNPREAGKEWVAIKADCARLGVGMYNEITIIEDGRI